MLIYKQRYKPRTAREFTGTAIDVYDSAGNTALNALTVYGKSEVVDGEIVSAGEGWATVRLADLTWAYRTSDALTYFYTSTTSFPSGNIKYKGDYSTTLYNLICSAYPTVKRNATEFINKTLTVDGTTSQVLQLQIKDTDYTTVSDFVASLGDATLCYELADPTQGNTIAVKTDDGTGIEGTMATFMTGTPLRGIPDTTVRDVMEWDGTSGEVTKKSAELDLGTLAWTYNGTYGTATNVFKASLTGIPIIPSNTQANAICSKYEIVSNDYLYTHNDIEAAITSNSSTGDIRVNDTNYTDATTFTNSLSGVMLIYELATPTTEQLTATENTSIAGLRTFAPNTHVQNNVGAEMTVDYTIRVPTV